MPRYNTEYERVIERTFKSFFDDGKPVTVRSLKLGGDGRDILFSEAHKRAKANLTGFMRWMSRAGKLALNDWEHEELRWLVDDLVTYADIWQQELEEMHGRRSKQDKIDALRRIAGRTPEEAEIYLAKADELEREE